jgi:hypothetical protein
LTRDFHRKLIQLLAFIAFSLGGRGLRPVSAASRKFMLLQGQISTKINILHIITKEHVADSVTASVAGHRED